MVVEDLVYKIHLQRGKNVFVSNADRYLRL
jgi:hypothetical protein